MTVNMKGILLVGPSLARRVRHASN